MAVRTPTSIFLLSVLVAGILSPSGLCALMCERRSQAETRQRCGHAEDSMSGMMHHHSATMNHADIDAVTPLWAPQLCPANCDAAERVSLSKKTAQVKVTYSGTGVPDITAHFLLADLADAWRSDGGPPARGTAFAATFSILRI